MKIELDNFRVNFGSGLRHLANNILFLYKDLKDNEECGNVYRNTQAEAQRYWLKNFLVTYEILNDGVYIEDSDTSLKELDEAIAAIKKEVLL